MELRSILLFALILPSLSSVVVSECKFTILVKTGTDSNEGMNATVSLMLLDAAGNSINIKNLTNWGPAMGPNHDYFQPGNLDVFHHDHACLAGLTCKITLTWNGSEYEPAWFVDFVEVITVGPSSCGDEKFWLRSWLNLDEPSYTVNHCNGTGNNHILRHQVNTL